MADFQELGSISVCTDSDTRTYDVGEVCGGFDDQRLKAHIQTHGHLHLLESLAYMTARVLETVREIRQEADTSQAVANPCS
ncbi:hypothetical protein BWI93_19200 [Siphonobacter sp. BAB-5385]|uniref:hypothetical protein n=1 Tax=Siphonobacter sp. BAB-5385 TaxID=1864822 RepID=UPI000B9E1DC3|nr:hypothetical protein [Siphonobacter sp. BAB-5385]OZI06608.1 hypothetical protein BWI93_19200 [Siphonobacter sp. BAB-5385]